MKTFIQQVLWLLYFAALTVIMWAGRVHAAFPADAIPADKEFYLWWDNPIRALPGVPLSERYTYYEIENRPLTWSRSGVNWPAGMEISSNGTVTWPNPVAGTYTGLQVTVTRPSCDTVAYPGCVLSRTNTFTLTVGTSDFLFVSTGGTDTGLCGTSGLPCRTIEYTLRKITTNDGKTVLLRGGTYNENWHWESGGASAPLSGLNFGAADYTHIRSYPGEAAVLDVSGALSHGFWAYNTQYVLFSNLEAKNATTGSGFLVSASSNIIVKDSVAHGSLWNGDNNVSGMRFDNSDNTLFNRTVSYDNHSNGGNNENVVDYMSLHDSISSNLTNWILNSKGWDSTYSILLKHSNCSGCKTIVHNFESVGLSFIGMEDNSSVRYSVFWNGNIHISKTDPSPYTNGGMLIENNTVISPSDATHAFGVSTGFATTGPITVYRNIFHQINGGAGDGNDVRKMMQLWSEQAPLAVARAYPFNSNYNLFYNSAGLSNSWIVGSNGVAPTTLDFNGYKALTGTGITRDPNSITSSPAFTNLATGNLNITASSPAATGCGSGRYCGAFRPDQTYGTVGALTTTLLDMDGSGSVTTTTTTTTTSTTTTTTLPAGGQGLSSFIAMGMNRRAK